MRCKHLVAIIIVIFASAAPVPHAFACSCPRWNASGWLETKDVAILVEVVSVGTPQRLKSEDPESRVPFTFKVIEQIKGTPTASEGYYLVGPPSSCVLQLQAGMRVALLLQQTQRVIGYCSAVSSQLVDDLRRVAKPKG
jgi:hypothetical protein